MSKGKVYYSHAIGIYNTERERIEIRMLEKFFPNYEIVNPREFPFNKGSKIDRVSNSVWTGYSKMNYCLEIVKQCDILVFSQVFHNLIGKGVYDEVMLAKEGDKEVYLLENGILIPSSKIKVIKIPDCQDWNYYAIVIKVENNKKKGE